MSDPGVEAIADLLRRTLTDKDQALLAEQSAARDAIYALSAATDGDRLVSEDDMRSIYADASVRFHRAYFGEYSRGPEDLTHAALMFACHEWMTAGLTGAICWPTAPIDSPAFAYNLITQMSAASASPQSQALSSLAVLCIDVALSEIDIDVDLPRSAFFAGLAFGKMGQAKATSVVEVLNDRMAKIAQASASARSRRAMTMAEKAEVREADIKAFAAEKIEANPFITDRVIQKLFRERQGLPDNTSNAEAKVISKLRREGKLPARRPMTDGHASSE